MPTEAQIAGGHKANLSNPNTSKESKQHSKEVLENEFNGGDGKPWPVTKIPNHHLDQFLTQFSLLQFLRPVRVWKGRTPATSRADTRRRHSPSFPYSGSRYGMLAYSTR